MAWTIGEVHFAEVATIGRQGVVAFRLTLCLGQGKMVRDAQGFGQFVAIVSEGFESDAVEETQVEETGGEADRVKDRLPFAKLKECRVSGQSGRYPIAEMPIAASEYRGRDSIASNTSHCGTRKHLCVVGGEGCGVRQLALHFG